jgi:hypothetical protein
MLLEVDLRTTPFAVKQRFENLHVRFVWTMRKVTSDMQPCRYKIGAAKSAKCALAAPFSDFLATYCFGNGSDPKFAWTNVHFSPFFT